MATAQEIIVRARQFGGIHEEEEPLQAYEATRALGFLKSMLQQWKDENTIRDYTATDLASAVTVIIRDVREEPDDEAEDLAVSADMVLAANLAVLMSPMYRPIDPTVAKLADDGKRSISARDLANMDNQSVFDTGLLTTNRWWRYA